MSTRAVLDTNVLISGVFWKGAPFRVLSAWQDQRFTLVISTPILAEYRRVLQEMMANREIVVLERILELIEVYAEMVTPASFPKTVCNDPDDDKFLETAVAGRSAYVISGDAGLLRLKHYLGIQIVSPAEFLKSTLL